MKKIALVFILTIIGSLLTSCSHRIPEGIEHKEFYNDMVNVLSMLEDNLKNKTIIDEDSNMYKAVMKYIKPKEKPILEEFISHNYYELDDVIKDGLNFKEKRILTFAYYTVLTYYDYIVYQNDNSVKTNVLIDENNPYSDKLKDLIEKLIDFLEIDYQVR